MNVKKEIFESLRLDLQEFAPQEFVAACYIAQVNCDSNANKIWNESGTQQVSHSGPPHGITLVSGSPSSSDLITTGLLRAKGGKSNFKNAVWGYAWNGYTHFISDTMISAIRSWTRDEYKQHFS